MKYSRSERFKMATKTAVEHSNSIPLLELAQIKTPAGAFYYIGENAILLAGGFSSFSQLQEKNLDKKYANAKFRKVSNIESITQHLKDYIAGDLLAINKIKTSQPGGEFYQSVWKNMRKIKAGKAASYSELALSSGNEKAVRATGTACARNAVPLVVPCHRVIRSGGVLGNYAFGTEYKKILLAHEGYFGK